MFSILSISFVSNNCFNNDSASLNSTFFQKYHPDKQASKSEEERSEAEAIFKTVGEAYEILSDKEKRNRYDQVCVLFLPQDQGIK